MFPVENEQIYFKHMCRCIGILERYIHKQCFYGKQFYKIPHDICAYPIEVELKDNKNKKQFAGRQKKQIDLKYLQILSVIAGADVLKEVKPQG